MKTVSIAFVVACLLVTAAEAQTVTGRAPGCPTVDLLEEFRIAIANEDDKQVEALLSSGCIDVTGLEYSLIEKDGLSSKVRVYGVDTSVVLWTETEALK